MLYKKTPMFSNTFVLKSNPKKINSMVNHHSYHQESLESAQLYDQINNNVNTDQFPIHFPQEIIQEHDHDHLSNNMLSNHEDMNLCYNQNMQLQDIPLPPPTPDLQNMFPNFLPNSSLSFPCPPQKPSNSLLTSLGLLGDFLTGPSSTGSVVVYDPLLPLNLPPQPSLMLTDLIQSLPNGYNFGVISNDNIRDEVCGAISHDGEEKLDYYENGVFEFKADVKSCSNGKGRKGKSAKMPFVNEKQKRVQVKGKFFDLRSLVPNPTKDDRASIVLDAIEYINELKRTVAELKIVVEKKRFIKDNLKRQKLEDGAIFEGEDGCVDQKQSMDGSSSSSLRSSWLHRKSKSSEVDVQIIDDEVTVKIVQQKRMNCLLFVSKVLDELLLDIHHAAGGLIGDSYSYIFNCKICEGSMVYASGIANKLIEAIS